MSQVLLLVTPDSLLSNNMVFQGQNNGNQVKKFFKAQCINKVAYKGVTANALQNKIFSFNHCTQLQTFNSIFLFNISAQLWLPQVKLRLKGVVYSHPKSYFEAFKQNLTNACIMPNKYLTKCFSINITYKS